MEPGFETSRPQPTLGFCINDKTVEYSGFCCFEVGSIDYFVGVFYSPVRNRYPAPIP